MNNYLNVGVNIYIYMLIQMYSRVIMIGHRILNE